MDAPTAKPEALTVREFCLLYGISKTAAYNEIRARRLEARKYGRSTFIPRKSAERWFAALPSFESAAA